jgi:hypothetical protein
VTGTSIDVRVATAEQAAVVSDILAEAAAWLDGSGRHMWRDDELDPRHIADDVAAGLFVIAWSGTDAAGTMKFQLEDPLFWPDLPPGEATYIHRLAVRRAFAGGGVSSALHSWRGAWRRRGSCAAARCVSIVKSTECVSAPSTSASASATTVIARSRRTSCRGTNIRYRLSHAFDIRRRHALRGLSLRPMSQCHLR